jgi:hypothetical protein
MARTVQAGTVLAAGNALTGVVVSSKVVSLAEGVSRMLLLARLKIVTGWFLLLAAVVAAGWTCAAGVSARAVLPGDDIALQSADESRPPAGNSRATSRPTEYREAEFVFRGAAKGGKTVSLVVAGTSAPVLCLPVQDDLRVLVGGRRVGINGLRAGTRVAIRLDTTNSVIQDIRALERPERVTALDSAKDLTSLESPSTAEVLRALPKVPRGVPGMFEVFRDDMQVVSERLTRQVDPPRFFPIVGKAELHHCHWKCTVYYRETVEMGYLHPARVERPCVEVVYIDKDYLVPTR